MGDAAAQPQPPSWQQTLNYYNPLHFRSKSRHHASSSAPVYTRDFAYAENGPVVLATPMRGQRDEINAETSAKTFAELLSGPTVDIYVGKERKHWSLHQNLLCHHSSYFETEFEGHEVPKHHGKKEEEMDLELPDDDARGFELLVKWLYQGQLEDSTLLTEEKKYDYAVACHKLFMLCDKFDIIGLKNLAMDQYRMNLNAAQLVPDADEINEIYRPAPSGSPFRALMTKIAARQIMDPEVDKDAESYRACFEDNPDFAVDMVNAIRNMSGGMLFDDPTEGDACAYHDHSDGSGCGGKGKAKAKPIVNGTGPKAASVAKKQKPLPAELSAEKRTPRKLHVPEQPNSPTPKPSAKRRTPLVNGHVPPTTPAKLNSNGHVPAKPIGNGDVPATPAKPNGVPSQPPSVAGGPRKLAVQTPNQTPAKSAQGNGSVLGKRRATDGNASKAGSTAGAPRNVSQGVNGIVQHLKGVNGVGSEDSQSTSGASELPMRKMAPKLRRSQG